MYFFVLFWYYQFVLFLAYSLQNELFWVTANKEIVENTNVDRFSLQNGLFVAEFLFFIYVATVFIFLKQLLLNYIILVHFVQHTCCLFTPNNFVFALYYHLPSVNKR